MNFCMPLLVISRKKQLFIIFLHRKTLFIIKIDERPTEFYLERLRSIRDDIDAAIDALADNASGEEHFGGKHDVHDKNDDDTDDKTDDNVVTPTSCDDDQQ